MADVQRALDDLCARRQIPGAAFGVMKDGEIVAEAYSGVANLDTGLNVTDKTLFQSGSIGKSYTATAVMQLVDDGLLDLDRPLKNYLPDLRFADEAPTQTLTARQILCHVAGIDGDRLDEQRAYGRGDDVLERYVAGLSDLPSITEPKTLWSYCNSGYIVLGRLIEVLTGSVFEDAMTERLIKRMGISDSLFYTDEMIQRSIAAAHVSTPDGPIVSPRWEISRASGPAGGSINTTLRDLLAFGRMHLDGGLAADGSRVLSGSSVAEMQKQHVACPEPELLGDQWGLGWFIRTTGPVVVLGHDGNTIGETASLRLVPERNCTWALLMNLNSQNWATAEFGREVVDPMIGTVTLQKPQASGFRHADLTPFVGTYESLGSLMHVAIDGDGLTVSIEPRSEDESIDPKPRRLEPLDETRFLLPLEEANDELPVTFLERASDGSFTYLHMGARAHRRR